MRLKVTFAVLNFCNTNTSRNIVCFNYSVFTHKLKGHAACDFNFIVKSEGSHVHWKGSNILETVLERDVVKTDNYQLTTGSDSHIWPMKSSNCNDLECP